MVNAKKLIDEAGGVVRFYVRMLCDLSDAKVVLDDKPRFKKLSARNGRALNRMKLSLRRNDKVYGGVMGEYRANPVLSSDDEDRSKIPKLNLAGETDDMVHLSSTALLCGEGGTGELAVHDNGHLFPTKLLYVKCILNFLATALED